MLATPIVFLLALLATASAYTQCGSDTKGDLDPDYGIQYPIHDLAYEETVYLDLTIYHYPCNPNNHNYGQPKHVGTLLTACAEGSEAPRVELKNLTQALVLSPGAILPVNITAIVTCKPIYPPHS